MRIKQSINLHASMISPSPQWKGKKGEEGKGDGFKSQAESVGKMEKFSGGANSVAAVRCALLSTVSSKLSPKHNFLWGF